MAKSLNLTVIGTGEGVSVCFGGIFDIIGSGLGCLKIFSRTRDSKVTLVCVLVVTKDDGSTFGYMLVVTEHDSCTFGCVSMETRPGLESWGTTGSDVTTWICTLGCMAPMGWLQSLKIFIDCVRVCT